MFLSWRICVFEWILTFLSITGTLFNIQKKIAGWFIWAVANLGWIISFTLKGMIAEATLFGVYFILSIYGIIRWSQPERTD